MPREISASTEMRRLAASVAALVCSSLIHALCPSSGMTVRRKRRLRTERTGLLVERSARTPDGCRRLISKLKSRRRTGVWLPRRCRITARHVSRLRRRTLRTPTEMNLFRRRHMSQVECPSCGLRIVALGAPFNCPRCLIRKSERVGLVAVPAFVPSPDIPPSSATESHASLQAG